MIVFPEDAEFCCVPQCTTGRVFILRFKNNRKMFFWMQEPNIDRDEEYKKKVNDLLNNPPVPGSRAGTLGADWTAGLEGQELRGVLGNMSDQQLMQLLSGMGGLGGLSSLIGSRSSNSQPESAAPSRIQSSPGPRSVTSDDRTSTAPYHNQPSRPATAAFASTSNAQQETNFSGTAPIQLSDLQNILSGLSGAENLSSLQVDLANVLTSETLIPILANAEVQQQMIQFLPSGESIPNTAEELRNTVQSPQFQQAVRSFSAALTSGQLGPLMSQFGLGDDAVAAAIQGDLEAFVKAIQSSVNTDKKNIDNNSESANK